MKKTTTTATRRSKTATVPIPEPTTSTDPTPPPAPDVARDLLAMNLGEATATAPWPNLRSLATCPTCGTEHAHVVAYLRRHQRKPTVDATAIAWLRTHAVAAGFIAK